MRFENVFLSFGEKKLFENFSFQFPSGGVCAVMGPSGCGKTTLLFLAAGLLRPDAGRVDLEGRARIGMVFQEDRLIENWDAGANALIAAPKGAKRGEAEALLFSLGLDGRDLAGPVRNFSGGMKRRVAIARALLARPELLLLDEPFKGLDAAARTRAAELIRAERRGAELLLVTHDINEAKLLGAETVLTLPARK